MASVGYGRALRARWYAILAVTLVVTCLAVLVPPAPRTFAASTALEDLASPARPRFVATALLGVPPLGGDPEAQFRTISFYLRSSEVASSFARRIGYTGSDKSLLERLVTVAAAPAAGTLRLSGYGGTRQQAADITNAFVISFQDYLTTLRSAATVASQARQQRTVDDLKVQIEALGARIQSLRDAAAAALAADPEADPDDPRPVDPQLVLLQSEYDALATSYTEAYQELTRLNGLVGATVPAELTVLEPPSALNTTRETPSLVYRLSVRVLLGVLLGLLLGAALALVLEHLGRRVSSRDAAERAFRSRVLVEVPRRRITGTLKDVAVLSAPASRTASAYRMLRAVLLADQSQPIVVGHNGAGAMPGPAYELPLSAVTAQSRVLGTGPSEQHEAVRRSVTVAERFPDLHGKDGNDLERIAGNGSAGSSRDHPGAPARPAAAPHRDEGTPTRGSGPVLVLAASAEEPVHAIVVANLAASLAEIGRDVVVLRLGPSARAGDIRQPGGDMGPHEVWARDTSVPGVQTIDWRPGTDTPPASAVVDALRAEGSVILVDTGRVATAEFAEVAPIADGVVAVCEYGRTRTEEAQRAADIIAWSHGTFRGVVLAQTPSSARRWLRWGARRTSPLGQHGGEGIG